MRDPSIKLLFIPQTTYCEGTFEYIRLLPSPLCSCVASLQQTRAWLISIMGGLKCMAHIITVLLNSSTNVSALILTTT